MINKQLCQTRISKTGAFIDNHVFLKIKFNNGSIIKCQNCPLEVTDDIYKQIKEKSKIAKHE